MFAAARRDEPAVAKGALLRVLAGLRALDVDPEPTLARLGIGIADLERVPDRLPPAVLYDLWQAVTETTGVRGFGVRIAEGIRADEFAMFGDVVATSATLGDALMRALRLFRLVSETVRFSVEFGAQRAVLTLEVLHTAKFHPESAEFLLAGMVAMGRRISGAEASPLEIRFKHDPPQDPALIERFFGCPVVFGAGENSVVFDSAALFRPVLDHDPERCAALLQEAESLLRDLTQPGAFRADVVNAISRELASGDPSIERVAASLELHPKTLGRRLRAEGTTYRRLLEDVRFRLARRYLEQPQTSITEIAFRLAYSEKSAFNRAFKRWTGSAPETYRRR